MTAPHYVDLDSWPEDERAHIVEFAKAHNALAVRSDALVRDIDGVSGKSAEEKAEVHEVMGYVRKTVHWLKSKRLVAFYATAQVWLVLQVLKLAGISISHDQAHRLIEAGLKLMEKLGGL